ncbi:MAG: right-handed parallel beta-helix repeat-containing protein [bacterium]
MNKNLYRFLAMTYLSLLLIMFLGCKPIEIGQQIDTTESSSVPAVKKSGTLTADEVWSGKILVDGDVTIPKGNVLTIESGATIKFAKATKMLVDGTLLANGQVNRAITLTSNESNPQPGDWEGIIFTQSSQNSRIEYCVIQFHSQIICRSDSLRLNDSIIAEGSTAGIIFESSSPTIEDNMITNNSIGIICDKSSAPNINHNAITSNLADGISCKGSSYPTISFNVISNNRKNGIYCLSASSPEITSNNITYNGGWAVYGGGKLISNYIRGNREQGMDAIDTGQNLSSSQYQGVENVDAPRSSPVPDAGVRKKERW